MKITGTVPEIPVFRVDHPSRRPRNKNDRLAFALLGPVILMVAFGYGISLDVEHLRFAAFDQDPAKAGTKVGDIPILPMEKLASLTGRMHIGIGILTVPAEAAQATADLMVQAGIRAIWNFAPVRLDLPADVAVENLELFTSLSLLLRKYAERPELALVD